MSTAPRLNRPQRDAYDAVRRACAAPHDSIALRRELHELSADALPADMAGIAITDPELGIFAQGMTWNYDSALLDHYYHVVYPGEAAVAFIDQARAGELATTRGGPLEDEHLRLGHMEQKLKIAFAEQGRIWGGWCVARECGSRHFDEAEHHFATLVAPLVAAALRRAALLEAAAAPDDDAAPPSSAPGVAVYDARGALLLRDERAARYLADLDDIGRSSDLPLPVAGAITQLRWRLQRPRDVPAASGDDDTGVRLRGRSGRWYAVHASAAESSLLERAGQVVVVVTPLCGGERASILARLYGLSPRERAVVVRLAQGESGKQIAAALGLSAHTVQAHIDNACARIGVRGRRELVARLFVDAAAARVAS